MVQLYLECICVLLRYTVCAIFHYSCESGKATHFKHLILIFKCSFNFRAENQLLFLMGFFFTYSSILFSLILYSYTGYVVLQLVQLLTFNL